MTITQPIVRDALPSDAPFLAQCILAGFHLYDFEPEGPKDKEVYRLLNECIKREDLLYTYKFARIAEVDGVAAGALLSYPGELYRGLRHKTFVELWPDLLRLDAESEQETGPGEYYLDSLAVAPAFRHQGIGRLLIEDGIRKGIGLGYKQMGLVADVTMPHLIRLYESYGFVSEERRKVLGIDFQRMVYAVR